MNPNVQMAVSELAFLKLIAGKNHHIVEIGCYAGSSSVCLSENNKVTAIDPLIPNYDPIEGASADMEGVEELLLLNIKNRNITWLKEKSEVVLKNWSTPIDGILIDGEHTTKALSIDIGWIKHVKPGGFIVFHDYGSYSAVTNLIDKEIFPRYHFFALFCLLVAFRK